MPFRCKICNRKFASLRGLNIHKKRVHKPVVLPSKEVKPLVRKVKPLVRKVDGYLIEPRKDKEWECWQTFNPGAILLGEKVHFIYRAIGEEGISRFGYANSREGFHLDERSSDPIYQHKVKQASFYSFISGGSWGGVEDPRIVRVGDEDKIYVTYTACDNGLNVALTSIKINDFLAQKWNWSEAVIISPPGEVHKNWVIFPEKIKGRYAILHSLSPKILIAYLDNLEFNGKIRSYYHGEPYGEWKDGWECWIKGIGTPPLKTKYGWLVFYHALHKNNSNGYCIGAMILDKDDPTKIICRAKEPVLTPWDIKDGTKPNIVYTNGDVIKDGKLLIYYGAADTYVRVAYVNLDEFLKNLVEKRKPAVEKEAIKIRNK